MNIVKRVLLLGSSLLWTAFASAAGNETGVAGFYESDIGVIEMAAEGEQVVGKIKKTTESCGFPEGKQVFSGSLMEDTLTGNLSLCQKGEGCQPEVEAFVVLLLGKDGEVLTGASHVKESSGCAIHGRSKEGSITLYRVVAKKKEAPSGPVAIGAAKGGYNPLAKGDPKVTAEQHLKEGFNYLQEGLVERARKEFLSAIEKDPARPEAYNGVGVTYYVRKFYKDAIDWYKKAIEVNPDFGDAYYNIACIYSLDGKTKLALKYLRISMLNGYKELGEMEQDTDLASMKDNPEFKKLLDEARKTEPPPAAPSK